jgi:DNA replicative helicase MCM subunit Mcm2 (Cdc46/Mcm family)
MPNASEAQLITLMIGAIASALAAIGAPFFVYFTKRAERREAAAIRAEERKERIDTAVALEQSQAIATSAAQIAIQDQLARNKSELADQISENTEKTVELGERAISEAGKAYNEANNHNAKIAALRVHTVNNAAAIRMLGITPEEIERQVQQAIARDKQR